MRPVHDMLNFKQSEIKNYDNGMFSWIDDKKLTQWACLIKMKKKCIKRNDVHILYNVKQNGLHTDL